MSIPDGGESWNTSGKSCFADTTHVTATGNPEFQLSNLGNLPLDGKAVSGGNDTVILKDRYNSNFRKWSETDTILGLSSQWTQVEANVFGDSNGSEANFNLGTSITVTQSLLGSTGSSFSCNGGGTTGESNNLFLGLCSTWADGILFTEASLPSMIVTPNVPLDAATIAPWTGFEVTNASAVFNSSITELYGVTPTGTVTYNFWTNSGCSGAPASSSPFPDVVTLFGGIVPNSAPTGPLSAGSYSFNAIYSGDSSYTSSASKCEAFSVRPLHLFVSGGISGMTVFDSTGETSVYLTNS